MIVVEFGEIDAVRVTITLIVASTFAGDRVVVGTARVVITAYSVDLIGPVGIIGTVIPIAAHGNILIGAITVGVVIIAIVKLGPITVTNTLIAMGASKLQGHIIRVTTEVRTTPSYDTVRRQSQIRHSPRQTSIVATYVHVVTVLVYAPKDAATADSMVTSPVVEAVHFVVTKSLAFIALAMSSKAREASHIAE